MNESITLCNIAGYCPEEAIWKMIQDLCDIIEQNPAGQCLLTPDSIIIDGDKFLIGHTQEEQAAFLPPEHQVNETSMGTPQLIWSLGALIYYASSGRILFGGHGGRYQQQYPQVALPVLQKKHQRLTPVMQRCLQREPISRISAQELKSIAQKERARCLNKSRQPALASQQPTAVSRQDGGRWPEEMIEI